MRDRLWRAARVLVPYGLVLVVGGLLGARLAQVIGREAGGSEVVFHDRGALALLAACALLAWVGFHLHPGRAATFTFSRVADLGGLRRGAVAWLASTPRVLRLVASLPKGPSGKVQRLRLLDTLR